MKFLEDISNSEICYKYDKLVIVISNRPRASHSSDFEITRAITLWIVLHSVQLLLVII